MKRSTALLCGLVAVVVLAAFAPAASANPPVIMQKTSSLTTVLTGACAFPITVDATMTETDRFFSDQNGVLTRANADVTEQDSFGANGKSLTGIPYSFSLHAVFDSSGAITQLYADGVVERVPLPDGSVFQSAGQVNFGAQGFPDFSVTPNAGSSRNLAGFCAALAS